MATQRQQKLAKAIVENAVSDKPKNGTELLVSTGYAPGTAEGGVKDIIEQKGVVEELAKLGFTEDKAKDVVQKIMNDPNIEPNSRLKAADMTFKVHGTYAPEKSLQVQIKGDVKDYAKYTAVKEKFEEELLESLQNETDA